MRATEQNMEGFGDIDAASGKYLLRCDKKPVLTVLMSPEVATSLPWRRLFSTGYFKSNLVCVVVDKAHHIKEWLDSCS